MVPASVRLIIGALAAILAIAASGCSPEPAPRSQSADAALAPATSPAVDPHEEAVPVAGTLTASGCITFDESGSQTWSGTAGSAIGPLGDALQTLADAHQDQVAGVAYCSDYSGVAIFVASPDAALLAAIDGIAADNGDLAVEVQEVAAPLSELLPLVTVVMGSSALEGSVTGGGPDVYTGGLRIFVDDEHWPLDEDLRERVETVVRTAHGSDLPLRYEEAGEAGDLPAPAPR
ncbi:hypothetical protein [Orlajensenia leifsoniae]|uniref:Uncharacterized protein n=1 Tax=Orlajensenia leifsoniae TaxID=2561933 RepID=A0A4Y9R1K1_9MICO|nr:hypothetical protein [Leifsonia flava]TFV98078.1 hypothetical protein E4M00_08545 [Leifsonia flava]